MSGKKEKSKSTKKRAKPRGKGKGKPRTTREAMEEVATSVEAVEDLLLPDAGVVVVHADAKEEGMAERRQLPKNVAAKPVEQKSPAEWAYERIILYIQAFEEKLDNEHEVVMGFTGGDVGTMRIEGMGYFAPDMVTFYGTDGAGGQTQLVQHVSQLNVMLRTIPKPKEHAEAQRIGFELGKGLKKKARN